MSVINLKQFLSTAFEVWFKQILEDFGGILRIFQMPVRILLHGKVTNYMQCFYKRNNNLNCFVLCYILVVRLVFFDNMTYD